MARLINETGLNRELTIAVMPDGFLQPEWNETKQNIGETTRLIQEEIYRRFQAEDLSWLLYAGFCDKQVVLPPSLDYWRSFAGAFTRKLILTPDLSTLRHKVKVAAEESEISLFLENAPPMTGVEYINADLLKDLWEGLRKTFAATIKSYDGPVDEFVQAINPNSHLLGRVFFHLVENKDGEMPFAFLATYSARLDKHGSSRHLPLKYALQEYGEDSQRLLELLTTVHTAAGQSALISELLETGELFHPLGWGPKEAFEFLKEIPLYEASGILCRIPNWWKGNTSGLRLQINMGDKAPSHVGMDAILSFDARLFMGDEEITPEEARELLRQSEGLAFIKNKWVAADKEKLRKTLEAYEKTKHRMEQEGLSLRDAFRLQLNSEKLIKAGVEDANVSVSNGQWLKSVVSRMLNPDKVESVNVGKDFKAELREYQNAGLNWLYFLHSLRFGACLADDMGLGKTVQLLGFLCALKQNPQPDRSPASLLVIPASLISNWTDEIERFYPALRYYVAHPGMQSSKSVASFSEHGEREREAAGYPLAGGTSFVEGATPLRGQARAPSIERPPDDFDLVITTYSLVQKYEWISSHTWNYIILDEAQAIKNPGTRQTRAVKKLSGYNRIVMTGTPVENRLSDLWSLFDFLNPGLLGNPKEFSELSKKLKDDPSGYGRLRKLVGPYILRRLKTDKKVISDLPDKVEMKTYAALSKKQVVLYQELVNSIAEAIENTEGIQRKGLILSSLMKFKQICNHPDQYLGTGAFADGESGKFGRLKEICETIYEKRERMLVFTQFREITDALAGFLGSIFERPGLVFHGGIPVGKRKDVLARFQGRDYVPFMVLSVKAGGVGLNLTEANHVVHFDRWWNPAVENQATDRVFRIGQKRNVMVHKFITRGTVEEKIDTMIEGKLKLSQEMISASGENWITEMDDEDLIELFRLSL